MPTTNNRRVNFMTKRAFLTARRWVFPIVCCFSILFPFCNRYLVIIDAIVERRRQLQGVQRFADRFVLETAGEPHVFEAGVCKPDGDPIPTFHLFGQITEFLVLEDELVIYPGGFDDGSGMLFIGWLAD